MVKCKLCGKIFKIITNTHLTSTHHWTLKEYIQKFGSKNCGFLLPNLLPKSDPRYIKWKESLKKRPPPWNKGFTKETHPSVAKISETFKRKKIDNFAKWREKMKKAGKIKSNSQPLKQDGDLAELIGVILGDGCLEKFPRTERLVIISNSKNLGFVGRYSRLVEKIFKKKSKIRKRKDSNCIEISLYQKGLSERLGISAGNKKNLEIKIPQWIVKNKSYLKRYLRGLYEAEGSFSVHEPTYTYKFLFANKNASLLESVFQALKILGFHPHWGKDKIQISRKEEVFKIKDLIRFRRY
jgi:hypothetical protein